jgi:L-asparaginase
MTTYTTRTNGTLLVAATGGTISMTGDTNGTVRPSLGIDALLKNVPSSYRVDSRDVTSKPGAHLTLNDVLDIASLASTAGAADCLGTVVVQGTDTIEEVAFALDLLSDGLTSIVVTGAMRSPRALGADGSANLADALVVAGDPRTPGLGAVVVMGGQVHAADLVRKGHPTSLTAFESYPGPLGWVQEGSFTLALRPASRRPRIILDPDIPRAAPRVEWVTASLSSSGDAIRRLISDPPDGLIVQAFGAGHVPDTWVEGLDQLASSCPVILTSRCGRGSILRETYGFPGSETDLLARGLIGGGSLDAPKATIALRLLVMAGSDREAIAAFFNPSRLEEHS